MREVRESLHSALLSGIPSVEGPRGTAPIHLQATPLQDLRVRGMRYHHRHGGQPLQAHQGTTPRQHRAAQVPGQATVPEVGDATGSRRRGRARLFRSVKEHASAGAR